MFGYAVLIFLFSFFFFFSVKSKEDEIETHQIIPGENNLDHISNVNIYFMNQMLSKQ